MGHSSGFISPGNGPKIRKKGKVPFLRWKGGRVREFFGGGSRRGGGGVRRREVGDGSRGRMVRGGGEKGEGLGYRRREEIVLDSVGDRSSHRSQAWGAKAEEDLGLCPIFLFCSNIVRKIKVPCVTASYFESKKFFI